MESSLTEPPETAPAAPDRPEMSVFEHLEELRWRIIKSIGALAVTATFVFIFNQPVILWLEGPLTGQTGFFGGPPQRAIELIFTSPAEYFVAVVKVALLGGIYLALPVILYQILAFISPGLHPHERRWALPLVAGSFVFFTLGMLFSYTMLLPAGLQFLVGFAPAEIKPLLSVGKYLGFAAGLIFAAGFAFLLPLFLLGLSVIGVATSYSLAKYRRYAFIGAFVLAAILTPSIDIFTQVMMAGALYLLFELGLVLIRLTGK